VNPLYLMLPVTVSASFAFMLPVATPPNAIVFAYGHMKILDMVKVTADYLQALKLQIISPVLQILKITVLYGLLTFFLINDKIYNKAKTLLEPFSFQFVTRFCSLLDPGALHIVYWTVSRLKTSATVRIRSW